MIVGKYKGKIDFGKYGNGRLAISFRGYDGIAIERLTTNLVDEELKEDEVFLDSNSTISIEETIKVLKDEGILIEKIGEVQSGYCLYPKWKINLKNINF